MGETDRIGVETRPSVLRYLNEPEAEINVGDLFEFKVKAEIKSGGPLQRASVKCNVTAYYEQASLSSEFFQGIAANSLSLEKASNLATTVEIDPTRAFQKTNRKGIATFYMKFLRGRN